MMAYHGSIFTISIILFALLAIASASDYGYGSTPNIEKSKLKAELDNKTYSTKSGNEVSKPKIDYGDPSTPKFEKSEFEEIYTEDYEDPEFETDHVYDPIPKNEKLKSKVVYKPNTTKPDYELPGPQTNYGYPPTPKNEKPKSKVVYKPNTTKSDYELPKHETNYGYPPTSKIEKSKPKTDYKLHPIKLDYEVLKPKESNKVQQATTIGVQGVIFCKSGSNYYPIQGAIARVTCGCVNELRNETNHISKLSHATDNKGYYFAKMESKLKINGCKAYLESSPLEICKVPTNVNHGTSGAPLSSYRLLQNNVKLYTVPHFFYTSHLTT